MSRVTTGIPGLDPVLDGGLVPGSCVLVSGGPGTGKTTMGLQFLSAGAALDEGGVYITFEEFPEQIYRDAAAFGWDLNRLEQEQRLQVVAMAPEAFLSDATAVDGLLQELHAEVGMLRVVIDSLNLMRLPGDDAAAARQRFYLIRNALRRLGVTCMFLHERQLGHQEESSDEFLADTVVHLTYDNLEGHRIRHLEVLKHRGSQLQPGRHIFVYTDTGLRLLPALNRVPDFLTEEVVPTGLSRLDECFGGGLPRGGVFALNVNSKCNYRNLVALTVRAHLSQGDGLITGRSSLISPAHFEKLMRMHGVELIEIGRQERWVAVDFADRPCPKELEPFILRIGNNPEDYTRKVPEAIKQRFTGAVPGTNRWLLVVDLNSTMMEMGSEVTIKVWNGLTAAARHYGHTLIAICNFEEMGPAMTAFVQRTATGVIRTWFDGRYQYLQVQKAPNGRVSEPMVIEYTEQPPYMALW